MDEPGAPRGVRRYAIAKGRNYALYSLLKSPLAVASVLMLLLVVVLAVFAPQIAPYDPYRIVMSERLQPPSLKHIMGTDNVGRDVFSRIAYGARTSLAIVVVVVGTATVFGTLIGAISGYLGRQTDMVIMRAVDVFLAIPPVLLAIVTVAALGMTLYNVMLGLGLSWWTWHARIVRGEVLRLKETRMVLALRAMGASPGRILLRHIIPNCAGPILVQTTTQAGLVVLAAAGLSFLGLGPPPPSPDWGYMIANGRNYLPAQWWMSTFPGIAILIMSMGFMLLGDYLRDYLAREVK
jgi:peptide/nickel transport system permease protein